MHKWVLVYVYVIHVLMAFQADFEATYS